jgi:D-serine ammonia-lyase
MSSNYPLPSKASLVQQFVGKTLKEIPLPAAVVDIAAVKRNCQRMSDAVKDLGFEFVPLVNVHKVRTKGFQ